MWNVLRTPQTGDNFPNIFLGMKSLTLRRWNKPSADLEGPRRRAVACTVGEKIEARLTLSPFDSTLRVSDDVVRVLR